jgi:outer membrane PBP1 activator LpoA protein
MAMRGKLILTAFVVLIVTLGLGFAWGASGRIGLQADLDQARQQTDLAEARAQILEARISLYNNNFGDASRHLEESKSALRRVKDRYQESRRSDAASSIDAALGHVEEAQRLAGKLDPSANAKAAEALEAIKVAAGR